jgi:glycolate oxidase FAD binding subunit
VTSLDAFAAAVGPAGPVAVAGGRTKWDAGGAVDPAATLVEAPRGIVDFDPADMVVRVGAGTPLAELAEVLAGQGQMVTLDGPAGATVGGTLMTGISGLRRPGHGPIRNALLQADYVGAEGRLVRAGGPTVKNVSGYDLCRLLVGSLGTLGLVGEVRLRTRPLPAASAWLAGPADPARVLHAAHRPACVLWDGERTWVLLEGHAVDVDAQRDGLGPLGLDPVDGPPALPPHRHVVDPRSMIGDLRVLEDDFVAEVGVGVVHRTSPQGPRPISAVVRALGVNVKRAFDPTGRLNPGRDPYWSAAA